MSIIEGSESRKAEESMLRRVLSHRAVLTRSVVEELERSDNWEWNPRLRSVMSTLRRPIGDELGVASAHVAADARNSAVAKAWRHPNRDGRAAARKAVQTRRDCVAPHPSPG